MDDVIHEVKRMAHSIYKEIVTEIYTSSIGMDWDTGAI